MNEQISFDVVRKDETLKWERLKAFLTKLETAFQEGRIVNNIDNEALIHKIIVKMEVYEKAENKRKM